MSYNIETRSITEFVTDSKIKLPRFQRKSTWTAKQNFTHNTRFFHYFFIKHFEICQKNV